MYQQVLGVEVGASAFAETIIGASHPLETYNASDFHPPPYNPSSNVDHQHHFPRFGHTNNFDALVEGITHQSSSSTSTDYIVGVCAGAMLIFGVALLWGMVIIGLKIAGQKRVGFLAGRLAYPECSGEASDSGTLPAIPEEGAEEEEDDEAGESNLGGDGGSALDSSLTAPLVISNNIMEGARAEAKFKRKVRAVRIAFFISGLGVIVSGALFYAKGIVAFERSLDTMHQGIVMVQLTANQAINVTETVVRDKDALIEDFQQTKRNTTGVLCEGDGEIAEQIQGHVAEFASALDELNAEVNDNLNLFADDLRHLIQMNNAEILFYVALSLSILLLLLIVSMMAVAVFSARGIGTANCCTRFLTNAILWPLFVVLLVLFWMFSLLFLVSSLAAADFCVNPDSVMTGLLYEYQAQFHSAIFEFVLYYVSGCQVIPSSQSQINDIVSTIKDVLHTVHELSETVMGLSLPALESECGLDSAGAGALQGGAELMHEATHAVNRAMIGVRTVLECKMFNPIYTTFVHDAICVTQWTD